MCQAMDSLGWLVYRINTPVLRSMFMIAVQPLPHARRAGGDAGRQSAHRLALRGPVLAFKAAYYMLSVVAAAGLAAGDAGHRSGDGGGGVRPGRVDYSPTCLRSASSSASRLPPLCGQEGGVVAALCHAQAHAFGHHVRDPQRAVASATIQVMLTGLLPARSTTVGT